MELLPAAVVVVEAVVPAFGRVTCVAKLLIVEDFGLDGSTRIVTIHPEADAIVTAPVLADPVVITGQRMGEATPSTDVVINL